MPRLGFHVLGSAWPQALLALALGPHPQRELTLMPRLGFTCPRLGMAAGALFTGAGAPPPARTDADASPRIHMSSARHGRRRFCTGAGPHPQRELTLMPRLGFTCPRLGMAAGALCTGAGAPPPARTDADASPRIHMSSARHGRRRLSTGAGAPPPARTDADASPRIHMSSARHGRRRSKHWRWGPTPSAN